MILNEFFNLYQTESTPAGGQEQLQAEFDQLQKQFDPHYQYSDDYTFWSKQNRIAQRISVLKKLLAKGSLNEFAPAGGDDREPDEEEILRQLAAQWWNGTEQQMAKAQRTLETLGWEIGPDESGNDDAGVYVYRIGDSDGRDTIAFGHSDLELNEGVTEGLNFDDKKGRWEWDDGTRILPDELTPAQKQRVQKWKAANSGKRQGRATPDTRGEHTPHGSGAGPRVFEQGVAEGLSEMDKSQTPPGRDGHVSHGTYGSRDKKDPDAGKKQYYGKMERPEKTTKTASDILNKAFNKGVAEGSEQEKPIKKSDWFDPTDMRSPEKQKAAYLNHLAAKKKNKNIKEQGVAEGSDHSLKKVWDRYSKHLMAAHGHHPDVKQINKSGEILRNIRKYVKDHHGQKAVDDMERYAEKHKWNEGVAEAKPEDSKIGGRYTPAEFDAKLARIKAKHQANPANPADLVARLQAAYKKQTPVSESTQQRKSLLKQILKG